MFVFCIALAGSFRRSPHLIAFHSGDAERGQTALDFGIRVIQLSVLVLQAVFLVLLEQFLRIAFRCHILPLQAIDGRLIDIVDHLRIAQLEGICVIDVDHFRVETNAIVFVEFVSLFVGHALGVYSGDEIQAIGITVKYWG